MYASPARPHPLDITTVCSQCYSAYSYNIHHVEMLRSAGCCHPDRHQWRRHSNNMHDGNSVTAVINEKGLLQKVRPLPDNVLRFNGWFQMCHNDSCHRQWCTYAHSEAELQAWNKMKHEIQIYQRLPPSPPLPQPPRPARSLSRVSSYVGGGLTKIKHRRDYELLPISELNERLLKEPLSRSNYVDKFHTLLYYEEHEHVKELKRRCDKSLKVSLFEAGGKKCGSLVGLTSSDVAYAQQAATHVEIMAGRNIVRAEISDYCVSKKGLDVVNIVVDENDYYCLKSTFNKKSHFIDVHFVLKHSYFRNLHISLERVNSNIIDRLIPNSLQSDQRSLPRTCYPDAEILLLDKEYQLLALKKLMACDASAPFLITGPFGTGKTRVLATAAINFLKKPANRVLICTSHLQSADAYIDNYFGRLADQRSLPRNVNPVRLVGDQYNYSGPYRWLFKTRRNHRDEIKQSRLIITTFLTAPQLIQLRIKGFTHILIDEGAQTREPETIAPLGLANEYTKIVIAGDHLQIGPQMLVLGDEACNNGLGKSLLQRLHELYYKDLPINNPYTALLLTNYRCHDSILRLPSNLFFESTLQVRTQSKLHPKTSSALEFVCTSADSSIVVSEQDYNEEEARITLEQVQRYVDPWPVAQWGNKDLSTVCVMASSRNQVRLIRKLLNQQPFKKMKGVQTLATYELQGREFRAIFISTLEVTEDDGSTKNSTKTICDRYVFNTVITRAQSLIVCVGNPFLLFSIEEKTTQLADRMHSESRVFCWREYVKRCLETSSFRLTPQCYEADETLLQSNVIAKLYEETFGDLKESLDTPNSNPHEVGDSILEAYKQAFQSSRACQNVKVMLGDIGNGDRGYVLGSAEKKSAGKAIQDFPIEGTPIECYFESITYRKAITTPLNSSEAPITINGVDNRRGALDGSVVKVSLYEDGDRCGRVCEVVEQGPQQQFVCRVDNRNSIFFFPIDRKNPKLVNLPGLSRKMLEQASNDLIIKEELIYKQYAVTVFDPRSFVNPNRSASGEPVDYEVPQIKDVIPLNIAQKLLFVVLFLRWKSKYRFPLGVVIAAIPKGLTIYHAQRMLLAHHHINTACVDQCAVTIDSSAVATTSSSLPRFDHALTIDPPEAKVLDDALTLESLPNDVEGCMCYQLGVHIANVGRALGKGTEADEIARKRGTAVYGSKTTPLFYPLLPTVVRENLSLDCGKNASVISVTCKVFITGRNIDISSVRVHESVVCSRVQFTYDEVQDLLVGRKNDKLAKKVLKYNESLQSSNDFVLKRKLAVLLQISEYFHRYRTQSDNMNYTIEDVDQLSSPQAYFLVSEMMIWANRIVAEHVLASFPELALLRRQNPPNEDRLTKALQQYEDAVEYSLYHKSLAENLDLNTKHGSFLVTEVFRKQLYGALQSNDVEQARNLLRVTSYHPQLAVMCREVNSSKSRAQYACSGDYQEQERLELQHGDYLLSLTKDQMNAYGHSDLCCLFTHATSPLRRYVDIVMQRLVLHSLSSSAPAYMVDEVQKICSDSNAQSLNAKQFGREFNRLSLALSLAQCSQPCTGYVASIERSLQLVIRELDCQHLSLDQCSFRLSSITNSATSCVEEPEGREKKKLFMWKAKIASFPCKYAVEKLTAVKESSSELTEDAMLTFYMPEVMAPSKPDAADGGTRSPSLPLVQHCYSAQLPNKTLLLDGDEWEKVLGFMKLPSQDTAAPLTELLRKYSPTEDSGEVKFPTNASFWLYEVKQSVEVYKSFKLILAANYNEHIVSPCIQLLEVAPMLNVCVQHSTNPAGCFSTPILSHASRIRYNDIHEYIDLWEKVLLAEAAVGSVSGDDAVQLIKNVPLKWPTLQQPVTSLDDIHYSPADGHSGVTLTIPPEFNDRCGVYFDIKVGNLVCARYDIPLSEAKEVEGRVVHNAMAVYHFVIDGIDGADENVNSGAVKKKSETKKQTAGKERLNTIVHMKIISKEAARVSSFMKAHLENVKSTCEIQIIPLDLPYRRMYRSLLSLRYIATNNPLCQQIALGKAINKKISAHSARKRTTLIKQDRLVFTVWPKDQCLNDKQHKSVLTAVRNKFQLIQGPPGTGKSVTGAHLAYAFIVSNPSYKSGGDISTKINCVMYCGPSNKSVDVVLDMFLKHPNIKDLRILRIYSKSIENKYHPGPHSSKVLAKPSSDQECSKDHKEFALHVKIRSKDCSLSPEILKMEEGFKRYSKENKLPSPLERRAYSDTIKNAQREIIRTGNYHIVFCTCNEASSVRVVDNIKPIQLIIDEAAMATEPDAMIPIQLAEHVTLIGDHMQLQPVINHTPAKEKGLGYSLFQRYAEMIARDNGMTMPEDAMLMLTTQYRMHEKICDFPSFEFYNGELEAHSSVSRHFCRLEGFWPRGPDYPIAFCDVEGKEEGAGSHLTTHPESKCNKVEADKIVNIIVALQKAKRSHRQEPKIAVLTPYKAQKRLVEELVKGKKLNVIVRTINESQGSEFDFVILSTVRSMPYRSIRNKEAVQPDRAWMREHLGFITDQHQICVGITRAKHGLVIVGNAMLLGYDKTWCSLLQYYSELGCKVAASRFPLQQQQAK